MIMRRQQLGQRIIVRFAPLLTGVIAWSGCGVDQPQTAKSRRPTGVISRPGTAISAGSATTIELANSEGQSQNTEQQTAILDSVLHLLSTSATNPGGDNFTIATEQLNQYFNRNATAAEFNLSPESFQFLNKIGMPAKNLTEFTKKLQEAKFSIMDARHIEDCMMYSILANRIAGNGDDMTRLRRIFDWVNRHVMVVPATSLAPPGMNQQAQARPFDCILRGMATEAAPSWAERTWVFMSLARQIRIDVGILVSSRDPAQWLSVALVEGKPYLFDCRTGLEIKTADGQRVATLDEAIADPRILQSMQTTGAQSYGPTHADLANGELSILADMSTGYLSPRMRLLEQRLAGKNRMVLFRDVADLEVSFLNVLKPRVKEVRIWDLPFTVESLLFTNPDFVTAAQYPLRVFDFKLPILAARMAQLRGETAEALEKYATMRFAENALMRDKITPIPPDVQKVIDLYSTYFLALCHMDNSIKRGPREVEQREADLKQAKFFLNESLRLFPEPQPDRPFFYMFRWNAISNLGMLALDAGDEANAVRYLAVPQPTSQGYGNSVLVSDIVWQDPFLAAQPPLPPAPEDKLAPSQEALRAAAAAREASATPAAVPANRALPGLGGSPLIRQPGMGLGNAPAAAGPRPIGPGGAAGLLPGLQGRP
jgi:hypothetical protein